MAFGLRTLPASECERLRYVLRALAGHRSYFYDPETSDKDGNLQQYQYNGRKLSFDGYFTDELASKAQLFVTESEQPFMLYMSFTAPHSPNEAMEEDLARFEGQPRPKYAAMMYALDRGVGKIVDELKAAGKFDNTIIFFFERQWRFHDQPVLQPSVERLQGK